ncbi:hypothetical protein [Azospirillum sp. sgz302134]
MLKSLGWNALFWALLYPLQAAAWLGKRADAALGLVARRAVLAKALSRRDTLQR